MTHPFSLVNLEIASTMDREGLLDWLRWRNCPDYAWMDLEDFDRDDLLMLVEKVLKEK